MQKLLRKTRCARSMRFFVVLPCICVCICVQTIKACIFAYRIGVLYVFIYVWRA